MRSLERIVSAYLDLAEDRAERHIPMTMEDWAKRLDLFLILSMTEKFFRMQAKLLPRLQRQKPKLNLKNIVSFRIECSCLTSISTCWNWKRMFLYEERTRWRRLPCFPKNKS